MGGASRKSHLIRMWEGFGKSLHRTQLLLELGNHHRIRSQLFPDLTRQMEE
jgi:hypothetical protein